MLLDVIRLSAALVVAYGHFSGNFGLELRNREFLGTLSVPVFFVLSGFVIRFVSRTRESTAREYFIDRASRIYSVVLPALVFTLVATALCLVIEPAAFQARWGSTLTHPISRIVANLLFVTQAWGHGTVLFVNVPFWSLGYECIYYLIYGFVFFLSGRLRLLLSAAAGIFIGPQVLFLLPVWWLGCVVYDVYVACRGTRLASVVLAMASLWLVAGIGFAAVGRAELLRLPVFFYDWVAGLRNPIAMLGLQPIYAQMHAVAIGILSAVLLFVLLLAVDSIRMSRSSPWASGFRHVANGTFAIYLMHYPFLVLLSAAGWLRRGHMPTNFALFVAMNLLLTAAAVPMDQLKGAMRRWLRRSIPVGRRSEQTLLA